jgi:hypothetical protein
MNGYTIGSAEIAADRQAIADQLGIPVERITDATLTKIVDDPTFLRHLSACRHDPQMLDLLLPTTPVRSERLPITTASLIARASTAVAKWAAAGFAQVPDEIFQQRRRACLSCEHIGPPPNGLAQLLARSSDERTHCQLCGCHAFHKARLATEACPDGRWGQEAGVPISNSRWRSTIPRDPA